MHRLRQDGAILAGYEQRRLQTLTRKPLASLPEELSRIGERDGGGWSRGTLAEIDRQVPTAVSTSSCAPQNRKDRLLYRYSTFVGDGDSIIPFRGKVALAICKNQ